MRSTIIEFISQYITITEEETAIIEDSKCIKEFSKGDVLLSEGEYATRCFYILEGCVRSYYLIDGEEKNTEFFVENATIVPLSYRIKQPSRYYLSCLEDAVISVATPEQNQLLIERVPKLKDLIVILNENNIVRAQLMYDDFKNMNPEQRYFKLIAERPDLIHRIPQYHLATFLGITPVSLSRLRARIQKHS